MDDRGIDSYGIKKQVVTLEYYIGEIKNSLNNIDMYFHILRDSYDGIGCNAINTKYETLSGNYEAVYNMLSNYCEQLEEVIVDYQLQDKNVGSYLDSKK